MKRERTGLILNYKTGMSSQKPKTILISVPGADYAESCRMIGHKVGWPADDPKIQGRIVGAHGKKGTLKARFRRGLPGFALTTQIAIETVPTREYS